MKKQCTLCSGNLDFFYQKGTIAYYSCSNCKAVLMDPQYYLSPEQEKQRYLFHHNDVNDIGYQKYVEPVVNSVLCNFNQTHKGLDFGAGPGPVVTKLLTDKSYNISMYDPFFCNDLSKLKTTYDYIVCSEVIEHFSNPKKEFELLKSLLNNNGKLICMTSIYNKDIDFKNWYYKDDITHRFFYHQDSLEWIKSEYKFSSLTVDDKLIQFVVAI